MPKPLMLSAAVKRAIYIVSPAQGIKPNIAGLIQGISPFSAEDCFHFLNRFARIRAELPWTTLGTYR